MVDSKEIEIARQRLEAARGFLHIEDKTAELESLDEQTAQPGFWDDAAHAAEVSRHASNIRSTLAEFDSATSLVDECAAALDLSADDPSFADEADAAYTKLLAMLDQTQRAREVRQVLGIL